jgi:hypothetical protein
MGFLLAFCQVTLLEELPGMVILCLNAAGACVLDGNQEQEQQNAGTGNKTRPGTAPQTIKPSSNDRRTRCNILCPADILESRSRYG